MRKTQWSDAYVNINVMIYILTTWIWRNIVNQILHCRWTIQMNTWTNLGARKQFLSFKCFRILRNCYRHGILPCYNILKHYKIISLCNNYISIIIGQIPDTIISIMIYIYKICSTFFSINFIIKTLTSTKTKYFHNILKLSLQNFQENQI